MRMQRSRSSGAVVLNDCYNANPGSMAAALQTLGASHARRFADLGEMPSSASRPTRPPRARGGCAGGAVDALFLTWERTRRSRDAAVGGLAPEHI
jgi:UDP-N-acetylmuramoyl-tripeptide--D-alanyl-D-alanine ligase